MDSIDDRTQQQLAAIAEVHALFEREGIGHWLFGGWAVDFHAGFITRAHDDVDLAIWLDDLPRIHQLLEERSWRHAPEDDEDGGTGYERGPVRLEVTYLVRADDGSIYTPFSWGRGPWTREALADDVLELHETRCRVVALAPLARSKASARDEPDEAAKDRADSDVLRRIG